MTDTKIVATAAAAEAVLATRFGCKVDAVTLKGDTFKVERSKISPDQVSAKDNKEASAARQEAVILVAPGLVMSATEHKSARKLLSAHYEGEALEAQIVRACAQAVKMMERWSRVIKRVATELAARARITGEELLTFISGKAPAPVAVPVESERDRATRERREKKAAAAKAKKGKTAVVEETTEETAPALETVAVMA